MPNPYVTVTLTFRTDSPPAPVAIRAADAATREVADALVSASWNAFDLDDDPCACDCDVSDDDLLP